VSSPLSFDEWCAKGQRFSHRGHGIFYVSSAPSGDAPALLLIHGFPTAAWDWHKLWPALCARFHPVIAADMLGFGRSAKPRDHRYTIHEQADLHEGLLRSLGVRRYHVLAHDYGDTVTQELLARRLDGARSPELLSACLLNGGLFPETHRARFVQRLLASPVGPAIARRMTERTLARSFRPLFGRHTQLAAEEISELWRLIQHEGGTQVLPQLIGYMKERRTFRERWVGALQRADVPLRVIDGVDDPVSGRHMVQRYRELVPNPDVVELPDIGHYPQLEASQAVLDAFFRFHQR
jgi:pimeloyl-ACP methyl ester carboxylesterase